MEDKRVSAQQSTFSETSRTGGRIIEDRPRSYESTRSIYAPKAEERTNSTNYSVERRSEERAQDRSVYERERYVPSTERTNVREQRSTDNSIYQPRINTDTRNNRYQPQNERIYVPRQRESAPERQATPQRQEPRYEAPRRIERRSEPAPQRQSRPSPSYERRGSDDNSGGTAAPSNRSGSRSSENSSSGRRGR